MKIKLFKTLKICEIVKRDQMFKLTKALHARHCCCGIMPKLVSLFPYKLVFRSQFLCLTTHNSQLFILFKVLIVVCSVPQALTVWRHTQNNRHWGMLFNDSRKWQQKRARHSWIYEIITSRNGKVKSIVARNIRIFPRRIKHSDITKS